jgi:hypothetical protein
MPDHLITLQLEFPPEVVQQEVWELEERLQQIVGITTDLRAPRDLLTATLLFIQIAVPYIGTAVTIAGGINTIHELAQTIYAFLHPKQQDTAQQVGRHKAVIITNGKRFELTDLSIEEIEKIIK